MKIIETAELLDPRQGFTKRSYVIEIRKCPLTGWWCRINVERAKREREMPEEEIQKVINELSEVSRRSCVFCKENYEAATPKFVNLRKDRYCRGKVILIPNLFPFGETHALAILDPEKHVRTPSEIDRDLLLDLLLVCAEYFKDVLKHKPKHRFQYINMNLFFPAGSSIIHPHAQIFTSIKPTQIHFNMISKARKYYERWLHDMYVDFILTELGEERYIRRIGDFHIISSYAPIANYDIVIISESLSNVLEADETTLGTLAECISRVLRSLQTVYKQYSINFAILSTSHPKYSKFSKLVVHVVCRKEPSRYYVNDVGFIELIHREPVVTTYPEDVAKRLRGVI